MLSHIISANEQEQYWRIPGSLPAKSLRTKAAFLERVLSNNFSLDGLDLRHLGCTETRKPEKKKKVKRGPNKWLPMR